MEGLTFPSAETHDPVGGGANHNFAPQVGADLQIIGGATFNKITLIGGAKLPFSINHYSLNFFIGGANGGANFWYWGLRHPVAPRENCPCPYIGVATQGIPIITRTHAYPYSLH